MHNSGAALTSLNVPRPLVVVRQKYALLVTPKRGHVRARAYAKRSLPSQRPSARSFAVRFRRAFLRTNVPNGHSRRKKPFEIRVPFKKHAHGSLRTRCSPQQQHKMQQQKCFTGVAKSVAPSGDTCGHGAEFGREKGAENGGVRRDQNKLVLLIISIVRDQKTIDRSPVLVEIRLHFKVIFIRALVVLKATRAFLLRNI